jgi:hypothetical protein
MGFRRWPFFCAGLLLLSIVFSYPLVHHIGEGMPYSFIPVKGSEIVSQHPGDYLQLFYRCWLFDRALFGKTPFFSNHYEFSTPITPPRFNTQGIPISLVARALRPLGAAFAYNAAVLLSFLASGLALALFIHAATGSMGAAMFCGAVYSCFPYRLGHLFGGHPGGFVIFLMPLSLYCIEKSWPRGDSGGASRRRAVLWGSAGGLSVFFCALSELHMVFYMGVLLPVYVAMKFIGATASDGAAAAWRRARTSLLGLAPIALAAVAYILWVKYSFLEATTLRAGRELSAVQVFNPRLADMLRISPSAERNIYLGIVPLALAVYGFFARLSEIRKRVASRGALLWLCFWTCLFIASYFMALGTATQRYLPLYPWLHANVPFLAYSRTPNRLLVVTALGLFMLCAYGIRRLLSKGRLAMSAVFLLLLVALLDYHSKSPIGISVMQGIDRVYGEVRSRGKGGRLLALPIWPGDDARSSIYGYYVTLTGVPMVNGYSPAPERSYVSRVFQPLRNLNLGEMRAHQYELLKEWRVPFVVLHGEAFPRKVSRYPFRFTLRNLQGSPFLEFVRGDGPHYLFRVRKHPLSPEQAFLLTSPVGILYPAYKMKGDVGECVPDPAASSGSPRYTPAFTGAGGWLLKGHPRIYPTGGFKALFRVKSGSSEGHEPVGRIEVYAPEKDRVVSARELAPQDFKDSDGYETFELEFKNTAPACIEFRVHATGEESLSVDFVYVVFAGEKDPGRSYEAEDLFYIGDCVEDGDASGGYAVSIGKGEYPSMPMVSGPMRLYGPGRYRARFHLMADEVEQGAFARMEVVSGFGEILGWRELTSVEGAEEGRYAPYDVAFEIGKPTPISFYLRHFNKAVLRLDRIEVSGFY